MKKVISINQATGICKKLRLKNKKIVLAGGCFDILHIGHIAFLEKAKEKGDCLFILLESDLSIKKLKGRKRPINNQTDRAKILASISYIDYVVNLNQDMKNEDYDKIVNNIKPSVIATTKGDKKLKYKKRQADSVGSKILEVTNLVKDQSTTRLVKLLGSDL